MRWQPGALAPAVGNRRRGSLVESLNDDRVAGSSAQVVESALLLRSHGAIATSRPRRRRNKRRMNGRENGLLAVESRHRAHGRNRRHDTTKRPAEAQSCQAQSKLDCLSLTTLRTPPHLNTNQLKFKSIELETETAYNQNKAKWDKIRGLLAV
jgi:hypothetical protein